MPGIPDFYHSWLNKITLALIAFAANPYFRFFIFSYIVRACKVEERGLEDYLPFETLYTMDPKYLTVRDEPE